MLLNLNLLQHFRFYKVSRSYLCQSRGWGGVWDRSGSRYRLWWFVHFTFFYGAALGWLCVASLSGEKRGNKYKNINNETYTCVNQKY